MGEAGFGKGNYMASITYLAYPSSGFNHEILWGVQVRVIVRYMDYYIESMEY